MTGGRQFAALGRRLGLPLGARGLFVAASAWAALAQPTLSDEQLSQFRAAEQAFAEQRYEAAAERYSLLARSLTDSAELHAKIGLSYFFDRQCDRSAPSFQRALELRPALKAARVLLAICLSELGRFREALPELEEGYADPPDHEGVKRLAGLELIRSYLGLHKHAQAAKVTAELQIAHPDDPEILFHANRTYREVAVKAAFDLARVAPESVWGHQAMGESYESRQYYDLAVMEYSKALAKDPRRPGLRFRLGEAMLALADAPAGADDALEQFELELSTNPTHAAAAHRAGAIHYAKTEYETALGYLQRAVRLRPGLTEARLALGRLLLDMDRPAEATGHLEQAVEQNPTDPGSRYQLARAHRATGNSAAQKQQLTEYRRLQSQRREKDQRILLGTPDSNPTPAGRTSQP